ncbi:hypothetical protein E1281_21770 [Actinomadura sp. KC345]|uniref:hypothetical protein n=1 Tax=Actinomadura sp. KC345 TaxID=2530371 RepID=UPI00104F96CC|nr:hypothetical protein [Actinomadura sp. KC345]TDC50543.1 hypothetical protein E1281_21770 [Actinomadura sp. KC345]
MNELPYMATLALRHDWARPGHARLQADIVEARLTARSRAAERGARRRALMLDWLRAEILDPLSGLRPERRPAPAPALYCARAAARSARAVRMAGGAR